MNTVDRTHDQPVRADLRPARPEPAPEPAPDSGWRIGEAAERVIAIWRAEDPYEEPLSEPESPGVALEGL